MKRGIIALVALVTFVSCGNATTSTAQSGQTTTTKCAEAEVVEVLYMHGKQRCVTCIAIGTEAEAAIKELASDKVVMREVDFSTPEGEKIADKYEIASSSIIVVKGDKVDNLTATGFRYAKNNPELFRGSLKESIQKLME